MCATSRNFKSRRAESGAALVVVLLLLALFAGLVADFLYNIRINTYLARNQTDQARAQFVAQAGISASQGLLLHSRPFAKGGRSNFQNQYFNLFECKCFTSAGLGDAGTALDSFQQDQQAQSRNSGLSAGLDEQLVNTDCGEWSLVIDYPLGEDTLHLVISDEQARLNLNGLVKKGLNPQEQGAAENEEFKPVVAELLALKLKELGMNVNQEELSGLVDLMVDWEDYGQVSGSIDHDQNQSFQDGDLVYSNKNGPMDTVSELKMIPGINDEIYYAVKDFFTVYPMNIDTGQPLWKVNTDMASLAVIYALVRGSSYQADKPGISEEEAMDAARKIVESGIDEKGFIKSREIPAELKNKLNPANFILNPDVAQYRWYHIISTALTPSGINYTIEAVVMVKPDGKSLRFVYWREG